MGCGVNLIVQIVKIFSIGNPEAPCCSVLVPQTTAGPNIEDK